MFPDPAVETRIGVPRGRIVDFCRRWNIVELALFGSVLRDDFGPESDVDVLVTFDPENTPSLLDHVEMQDELAEIFARPVDLVSRRGVERSQNPFWQKSIFGSARVVYAES